MQRLPQSILPLKPVDFLVLLSLETRDRHGYGLMQVANRQLRRRALLGPGTLYRTLKELREDGLIAYAPAPADADSRRHYYQITPQGRRAARLEASRMAAWVDVARAGRLLEVEVEE